MQHTYSCLFGTFLCNNAKERGEKHTQERTCSVWSLLRAGNKAFKNLLYSSQSEAVGIPQPRGQQEESGVETDLSLFEFFVLIIWQGWRVRCGGNEGKNPLNKATAKLRPR